VASGATIGGTTRRVQTHVNWAGFGWASALAWWLAVSISTLLIGLALLWLVGRGATRIEDTGRTRIGPSIGWGLLAFFGLPILAILALVTILGIPLGLGVLAALALIYTLGYTATAWIIGRRILGRAAWVVAFLLGWGILRALALIPAVGSLIWFVAVVFGLGALTVTIWRARSTNVPLAAPGRRSRPFTLAFSASKSPLLTPSDPTWVLIDRRSCGQDQAATFNATEPATDPPDPVERNSALSSGLNLDELWRRASRRRRLARTSPQSNSAS
jgi:hypothetical protein